MDREHFEPKMATLFTVLQVLVVFCPFQTAGQKAVKEVPPKEKLRIVFTMKRMGFGDSIGPALLKPVQQVRDNLSVEVEWKILDTDNNATEISSAFFHTITEFNPHLIVGEQKDRACETMATLAAASDTLFIPIACNPRQFLMDRNSYATFASVKPGSQAIGLIMMKIMQTFSWTRIGIVTALNEVHLVRCRKLKLDLEANGKDFFTYYHATSNSSWDDYCLKNKTPGIMLEYLAKRAQLFILIMNVKEAEFVLRHAKDLGYMNGSHAFVVFGLNEQEGLETIDMTRFEGVISLDRYYPTNTSKWKNFEADVRKGFDNAEWKENAADWTRAQDFDTVAAVRLRRTEFAALLHDGVLLWMNGLLTAIKDPASNVAGSKSRGKHTFNSIAKDAPHLAKILRDLLMEGVTGTISLKNGQRQSNWTVSMIQEREPRIISLYDELKNKWTEKSTDRLIWPGGGTEIPKEPLCFEDRCDQAKLQALIMICVGLAAAVVFIIIVGFIASVLWKRVQEKQIIANWKITWSDVALLGDSNVNTNSSIDRKSVTSSAMGRYFTTAGTHKGSTIAIKAVARDSVNIFERSIYKELKQMVYVKHDNINPFIGVCVDHPNVCVAMAYAEKGSIQNVLADPQFDIDWEFRMSLAMDVAKGMEYLHSTAVGSHGHLTSSNCVIDERWVCKITDYGLRLFRCIDKLERPLSDQMWTAPEILRKKHSDDVRVYGTKPGDVYSFGIIISELLTRELPYQNGVGAITLEELLAKVKMSFEPPFRPYLPPMEGHIAAQWIGLANNCWQTVPDKRPTFKSVKNILLANHSGKFTNVLERMQMILEESIERANTDLMVERRKTETMLESILPRPVVETITTGAEFEPQLSDAVTLCMCDTLGFYKATNELPADVVVDVLKSMYQQYDEIVGKYQAFEISTSGSRDSMMLAGGLPVNPKVDAAAICTMSLELLSFIQTFTHPRIESRDIQMKTTIHTGPAYAAVMGKQIPQFCVFGEMVQTTATLHTFGNAMTIRISSTTRDQLPASSGLKVEGAEIVTLKDTTMIMYVVTGKEGFNKPLPSSPRPSTSKAKNSASTVRQRPSGPKVSK